MGWEIGQPAFRQVSWTGGRTYRVWFADCPGELARRGNRRVSLIRPGEAPASHTCGGLVFCARAAGTNATVTAAHRQAISK